MSRYPECDLSKLKTIPVGKRKSLVSAPRLYQPPDDPGSIEAYIESLPHVLGAASLKALIGAIVKARARDHPVIAMCGAHVLKTGMGPGLIQWIQQGVLTGVAFHGAGSVHDVELGLWGATSEDVAEELHRGRFGMARETAAFLNGAAREAAEREEGLGEAIGRRLLEADPATAGRSVLAAAYRANVPATVHVAIGTDIHHQHPDFDGGATGESSARDFRILANEIITIRDGVVLNLGSAVILPEVFLKAVSVAINLDGDVSRMTTAVFDFIRHYRPAENVVRRPTMGNGRGYYLIGQHEILLPILFQACLARIPASTEGKKPQKSLSRIQDGRKVEGRKRRAR